MFGKLDKTLRKKQVILCLVRSKNVRYIEIQLIGPIFSTTHFGTRTQFSDHHKNILKILK